MADDVIWIVTDETPANKTPGARDGGYTGNPLDEPEAYSPRRGVSVSAEKLKKEMSEFVKVMGSVLDQARESTKELAGMTLDEVELSVEVNGEGQLSLWGIGGGKVGGKGAMTLKFKASKAP